MPHTQTVSIGACGYGTVNTVTIPYNQSTLPTPDSPAMETALTQRDMVLDRVTSAVKS